MKQGDLLRLSRLCCFCFHTCIYFLLHAGPEGNALNARRIPWSIVIDVEKWLEHSNLELVIIDMSFFFLFYSLSCFKMVWSFDISCASAISPGEVMAAE